MQFNQLVLKVCSDQDTDQGWTEMQFNQLVLKEEYVIVNEIAMNQCSLTS